ncbi:unnamed protein product [Meganyctiphanes norvegica]|uniref:Fibrinogen C-terminal domain-containing protein n=1 Tax=Meganyctiphanes norvegica TaxID=48144 RepID=A0AAV2RH82_MEGNR
MLYSATFLLLTAWTVQGVQNNQTIITGPPRNCQDLYHQGWNIEGHYVVYPETSTHKSPSIIFCSVEDGMEAQLNDIAEKKPAQNCLDLLQTGMTSSGLGVIYPYLDHPADPVLAFCDQETDGGGWTVIQKRFDGSVDFYRSWDEFAVGFGNPNEEHYIGNDIIASLTGQRVNELRVDLKAWDGATAYAHYQAFHIDPKNNYQLQLALYDGTANDSLITYGAGQGFTTFDHDNDGWDDRNCGEFERGGWWYRKCYYECGHSNLNGLYYPSAEVGGLDDAMFWHGFRWTASLKASQMMVRPYAYTSNQTGRL